jgi:hypothetical protein
MPELTLQQIFGNNATQTATELIISKADLITVGLTASSTNTGESNFVALMLLASRHLNEINQSSNPDIQVTITDSGVVQLVSRNSQNYKQIIYTIKLQTPDSGLIIDPDNY